MIIAIDYDGTIANTNQEKVKWIETHLGKVVSPWECNRSDCVPIIGPEAYERMGSYVYERESTLRAEEVPGALDALRWLSARADLYVVTARPIGRIHYAREWLESMGALSYIREIMTSKDSSKAKVCCDIGADILIDDDPRHVCNVEVEGLLKVLLQDGRPEKPDCDPDVTFCRSWEEVLAVVDGIG